MSTVNETIRDRALLHALAIRKYDRHLVQKIVSLLNEADTDLVAKIAGRVAAIDERGIILSAKVTKQLQNLLDEIRAINSAAYSSLGDTLTDELVGLAGIEAEYQAKAITRALPVAINIGIPTPTRLRV